MMKMQNKKFLVKIIIILIKVKISKRKKLKIINIMKMKILKINFTNLIIYKMNMLIRNF